MKILACGGYFNMQFIKYIISGVANTVVGYGVFLILLKLFHISPEYANASGYAIALVVAFILNKVFVFKQSVYNRSTIPRFLVAFIIAFFINQLVLMALYRVIGMSAEIAQIFAMISYTIIFYFLNKKFVFHSLRPHSTRHSVFRRRVERTLDTLKPDRP